MAGVSKGGLGGGEDFMQGLMRRIIHYWLPPFLWMGVIFYFSTDRFASEETGSVFGQLVGLFFPGAEVSSFELAHFAVRKLGHLTEYAILALLWLRAFVGTGRGGSDRAIVWRVVVLTAVYALLDEWHQSFTARRGASLTDSLIDISGAALALAVWYRCYRPRSRKATPAGD